MRRRNNMMMRAVMILLLIFCFSMPLFGADGVFREVSGKVEYRLGGEGWSNAAIGVSVPSGAQISTGFNSKASLEIESAILKIRPLTRMSIEELVEKEGVVSTNLHLKVGRIRAEVQSAEDLRHDFRVRSALSTAAVKGTSFEYDGVNVKVFDGTEIGRAHV